MATARFCRQWRERARAAFNLTSNFLVAAWQASRSGAFPAIRPGIGFSGHAESDSGTAQSSFFLLVCAMQRAECSMLYAG